MSLAATAQGVILGTAPYMSPEQARGQMIDQRADIWAFGCVVYEMLTGRQAYRGDHVSDILASVLAREPDYAELPASTPLRLKTALTSTAPASSHIQTVVNWTEELKARVPAGR